MDVILRHANLSTSVCLLETRIVRAATRVRINSLPIRRQLSRDLRLSRSVGGRQNTNDVSGQRFLNLVSASSVRCVRARCWPFDERTINRCQATSPLTAGHCDVASSGAVWAGGW